MIRYKNIVLLITIFFVTGCVAGDNFLGGIGEGIYFPVPRKNLEAAIDTLYARNPEYKMPEKWKDYNDWRKKGYKDSESRVFYFKYPEEMYYVTFVSDSKTLLDSTTTAIAIRAIYNGNRPGIWLLEWDLKEKAQEKIVKRFNDEIVRKLEKYTHKSADEE